MANVVTIKLADDDLEQLTKGGPEFGPRLSRLLDEEVTNFDEWMQRELNGRLIPLERTMLKTYLFHKIRGRVTDLEKKSIDPVEAVASSVE